MGDKLLYSAFYACEGCDKIILVVQLPSRINAAGVYSYNRSEPLAFLETRRLSETRNMRTFIRTIDLDPGLYSRPGV